MLFRYIMVTMLMLAAVPALAQERAVPAAREQIQLSFAPLVKKSAPAVVNIYASKRVQVTTSPFLSDPLFGNFFEHFGMRGRTREKVVNSLGSGVIVDKAGLIITNSHVIGDQQSDIRAVLFDGHEFEAEVVLVDKRTDLALLKISPEGRALSALPLADPDSLEVGDLVLAIGNPFGVGQTVTNGIVSALARTTVGVADYEFFIQTDAAINPGNSGGALINMAGELVGVNTAIYSNSGGNLGIGFATPSNMAEVLLASYRQGASRVIRPWLGASLQNITREIAESLGMKKPEGVLVNNVFPGSSASRAGIVTGDVITAIDDKPIANQEALKFHIGTRKLESWVNLTVLRNGKRQAVPVKMEAAKETTPRDTRLIEGESPLSGAIVENLSPALADELGISRYEGVIVSDIHLRSPARRVLQAGDIILSINGKNIRTVKDLPPILKNGGRNWQMQILRGSQTISINATL